MIILYVAYPLAIRSTHDGPQQVCAADFRGPIGGKNGDYFHVLLDTYSRWPEVSVTQSTSFKKLYPALDRSWARMGIPELVVHDGGPPYESHRQVCVLHIILRQMAWLRNLWPL